MKPWGSILSMMKPLQCLIFTSKSVIQSMKWCGVVGVNLRCNVVSPG